MTQQGITEEEIQAIQAEVSPDDMSLGAPTETPVESTPEAPDSIQAPGTGPYEFPADIIPAVPQPPTDPRFQEENVRLRQQVSELQGVKQVRDRDQAMRSMQAAYMEKGHGEEYARVIAEERMAERIQGAEALDRVQQDQDFRYRQQVAAVHYAKENNIDPSEISDITDEAVMVRVAKRLGGVAKALTKNGADIEALQKGRVPEQQFAKNTATGGVLDGEALEAYIGNPNNAVTKEMWDRLDSYHKIQGVKTT